MLEFIARKICIIFDTVADLADLKLLNFLLEVFEARCIMWPINL